MLSPLIAGLLAACGGGGAVHVVQVQFADANRKLRVTDASDTTYLIDIVDSGELVPLVDLQLEVL